MTAQPPLLWVILGPNGAGKSTFYEFNVRPRLGAEFVNADEIQRASWPDGGAEASYPAAQAAQARRDALLAERVSFVTETVASHPSKLALIERAQSLGYEVWVTFVSVASADLAVERYARVQDIARRSILMADRGQVFDNSDSGQPLRSVLTFSRGELIWRADQVPQWADELFDDHEFAPRKR